MGERSQISAWMPNDGLSWRVTASISPAYAVECVLVKYSGEKVGRVLFGLLNPQEILLVATGDGCRIF